MSIGLLLFIITLSACFWYAIRWQKKRFQKSLQHVCAHEAGHLVVAWYSDTTEPLGIVIHPPDAGVTYITNKESTSAPIIWDKLAVFLAGYAAEQTLLGGIRRDSQSDLRKASALVVMLAQMGFPPPPWTIDEYPGAFTEVQDILHNAGVRGESVHMLSIAYLRAQTLLLSHQDKLLLVTKDALKHYYVSSRMVKEIFEDAPLN